MACWPLQLALLVTAFGLAGCDDKPKQPAAPPTTSASATATTTTAQALPTPKALDVKALKASLKCGTGGHGPCGVLDAFTGCISWSPVTSGGDGRWLGEGYIVKKGAFLDELTLLRSKRVPLADVGPGQLPAKIGITSVPDDRSTVRAHARKAINAYKRGDVPKKNINRAITYINERQDWPEAFSMKADGNQVYVAVDAGAHLCALKDQRLLVVKLSGNREHKADGVYATLYPVSW